MSQFEKSFSFFLQEVREPLLLTICSAGLIGNCLSVIVLTRPRMRRPFSILLACLATSDAIAVLTRGVLSAAKIHAKLHPDFECTQFYAYLDLTCRGLFTIFGRNMNIWMTLGVAAVRYRFISRMSKSDGITKKHICLIVLCAFIMSTHIHLVFFFVPKTSYYEDDCFQLVRFNTDLIDHKEMKVIHIVNILLPVVLLCVYTGLIISVICKAEKQRRLLTSQMYIRHHSNQTLRISVMILIMMSVSMFNVAILIVIYLNEFTVLTSPPEVIEVLGDVMFPCLGINCSLDFWLFLLSCEFRETLKSLFSRSK